MTDYNEMSVEELELEIQKHNKLYWEDDSPEISDQEYDVLIETLRKKNPDSPVLSYIPKSNFGDPVKHDVPMLSLDKAYNVDIVKKWFDGTKDNAMIVSPKMDGVAVDIRYEPVNNKSVLVKASTRGNGLIGEDITENIKQIENVPKSLMRNNPLNVRGEVVMPLSVFNKKFSNGNSNPRNLASGSLKQKKHDVVKERGLVFYAYNILASDIKYLKSQQKKFKYLSELGFLHVEAKYCPPENIEEIYEYFLNKRDEFDFEIDGVVYCVNSLNAQESLGSTSHHPKWAIAWKTQGESSTTKLLDIEWSISRTGIITPVAIVEPVKLSGATINKSSLHHAGFVKSKKFSKNCIVEITRRGGVIPHVERVVKDGKEPFKIPETVNGLKTVMKEDFLYLENPDMSQDVMLGRLRHFVKVVEMDGFGDKIIQQLFDSKYLVNIVDFYKLTKEKIMDSLERSGEKTAENLLKQIEEKRKMEFGTFLRSLGIDELGKHVSKILSEKYKKLDDVFNIKEEDLSKIKTIGDTIAKSVVKGLSSREKEIRELSKEIIIEYSSDKKKSGKLVGKSICFTGSISMGRKKAQKLAYDNGASVKSSVSKNLDFLVAGEDAGSKLSKAEKLDVEIINEEKFMEMIGTKTEQDKKDGNSSMENTSEIKDIF